MRIIGKKPGVQQYVDWSSTAKSKQDFYTDNECKKMFKDTIKTIVTRRNTINNLLYSEDATIMSYNLINGPMSGLSSIDAWKLDQ